MSKSKALAQAKFFKEVTMSKLEPYLKEFIFNSETSISDFFEVKTLELLGYDEDAEDDSIPVNKKKVLKKVKREVLICNDVPALALFLIQERELNDNAIVKIGLDGGRGSFKICMSIHDKNEKELEDEMANLNSPKKPKKTSKTTKEFLNSGVKKVMILALAENVPEKYENVQKILELLDLEQLEHCVAIDLKLQNVMCGMQGHSATHPCCYCEGSKPWDEPAALRTFGSLREDAEAFAAAEDKDKIPKNFNNVVHPPLFNHPDDVEVLDVIPLAELHLMLGITNTLLFRVNTLIGDNFVSIVTCMIPS